MRYPNLLGRYDKTRKTHWSINDLQHRPRVGFELAMIGTRNLDRFE